MMATGASVRDIIIETINKLFVYTDSRNWEGLLGEVFTPRVWFDMASAGGGEPAEMEAGVICSNWKKGFEGIDAVHHQAGNYLVSVEEESAAVYCYAIALHYKKDAINGTTREFVGDYDLQLHETPQGWRIKSFRYLLKFVKGNAELK